MSMILKGETTRHIQKCYPPAKDADKRPIPNELSQLVFYLQTHRQKIPKAARLLLDRAAHFYARDRLGPLLVTAHIFDELVVKLGSDFSLYEEEALAVIETLLARGAANGDTDVLGVAEQLYTHYIEQNRGVHFLGHEQYCQQFLDVAERWARLARAGTVASRVTALQAIAALARSRCLDTSTGRAAVERAMPGILPDAFDLAATPPAAEISLDGDTFADAPSTNAGSGSDNAGSGSSNDNARSGSGGKLPGRATLHQHAAGALRAFLDTNSYRHTGLVVRLVLAYLAESQQASGTPAPLRARALAGVARWVPPQNRFLITRDVVAAMLELPPRRTQQHLFYNECLGALLVADFSKVDLSVVDTLQQLLRLQRRFLSGSSSSSSESGGSSTSDAAVVASLRNNIGLLADTHVYPGQCNDMLNVIMARYSLLQAGAASASSASAVSAADQQQQQQQQPRWPLPETVCDLKNFLEVLARERKHEHELPHATHTLTASVWEGTHWLLAAWPHPQPLALFCTCFAAFFELGPSAASLQLKRGTFLFRHLCSSLLIDNLTPANYVAIYYCLVAQIEFYGRQQVVHLLPWLVKVAECDAAQPPALAASVCRTSVVMAALLAVFRVANRAGPAARLFANIETRVASQLWLPGVTYPLTAPASEAVPNVANAQQRLFPAQGARERVSETAAATQSVLQYPSLESLGLSAEEIELVRRPLYDLDTPLEPEEIRTIRGGRAPSVSANAPSSIRSASSAVDPRIAKLRRRQTEILSLRAHPASAAAGSGSGSGSGNHHQGAGGTAAPGAHAAATTTVNTPRVRPSKSQSSTLRSPHTRQHQHQHSHPARAQPPVPREQIVSLLGGLSMDSPPRGSLTV